MLRSTLGLSEPREELPLPQKSFQCLDTISFPTKKAIKVIGQIPFPIEKLSKSSHKFISRKKTLQRPWTSSLPQRVAFKVLRQIPSPRKKLSQYLDNFPSQRKKTFNSYTSLNQPTKFGNSHFGRWSWHIPKSWYWRVDLAWMVWARNNFVIL